MNTGGSTFELIMQELLNQKQRMEELQDENRMLHRQLADLRDGRGVFIEVEGKRFPLIASSEQQEIPIATAQDTAFVSGIPDAPMSEVPHSENEAVVNPAPVTPLPETELVPVGKQPASSYTFLEDALLDEFTTAATSPMAVWTGPARPSQTINEDQNAVLRRELMGSFLLE